MTSISTVVPVKAVRDALPATSRERSLKLGLAYFSVSLVVYAVSFVAIALVPHWWQRVVVAIANGLAVGILFIVGHDACHGSLTPNSTLNGWLGRIAFLPSLHPYAAWEYSHNALHHGWTNLKGKDPVYCPRSVDEFRRLSKRRQWFERFFRSWAGLLPLYLVRNLVAARNSPDAEHRRHIDKRGTFAFDRGLVLAFPFFQLAILSLCVRAAGTASGIAALGVCAIGIVVPFLAFNWLIGFATFQPSHTSARYLVC
jgi:omega-6 fatty acid desaturase (delta-12 desaturase)